MESTEVYTARSWSAIPQDDCKEITKLRLKAMIFGNAKQWISSWIYTVTTSGVGTMLLSTNIRRLDFW